MLYTTKLIISNSKTDELMMGDMNTRNFLHRTVMHENRQVTLLWTGEITNEDDDDAGNYGYQPNGQLIHTNYESAPAAWLQSVSVLMKCEL